MFNEGKSKNAVRHLHTKPDINIMYPLMVSAYNRQMGSVAHNWVNDVHSFDMLTHATFSCH